MAQKSVFLSKDSYPFFEEIYVEMDWFGGFALSQKRKCELSLHLNFLRSYPNEKVLEVSSSSLRLIGANLSAMNLSKTTSKGLTSVESAFQSSKVCMDGNRKTGPFPEYLLLPGRECKKLVKEKTRGLQFHSYEFDGVEFVSPVYHISLFYDYLYLTALMEEKNRKLSDALLQQGYTAFTDLATKSLNCQARSCAVFIGVCRAGKMNELRDYDSFMKLFRVKNGGREAGKGAYENIQFLVNGKALPISPVVPCTIHKEEIDNYYLKNFSQLTNKKMDPENYIN